MIEIKKILLNNFDIKLISLLMAVILWFYISSEYNVTAEKYYDIGIKPINLNQNLSVKEIRDTVSVGIKGPKNILENISSQKIIGTVDLGNIEEYGDYILDVDVVMPKNTDIVKKIPNEVRVIVEKIMTREYVVEYNLIGLPRKGYSLKDEPMISPGKISIRAPESVLNQIGQVKIDIDISSISENIALEKTVIVYGKDQNILRNLEIQPKIVAVSVEVGEGYPEKYLPVKPRIVGKPAPGFFISKIEAKPSNLQVYGNYSKIGNMDFIETIPIDVNGVSKTLTVQVPTIISEGIYLVDEKEALIEIQIQIEEKEEEKIFKNMVIELREASPFVHYQLDPEKIDIKVSGKYTVMSNLNRENVKVFVNLYDTEKEKIKIETELPPEINLIQVIPEEVIVLIKK